MLVLGSNFYINSAGSETRYNTSEESSGIILNRNGDINLKTGGTGATATTRIAIDTDGETTIQGDSNPCLSVDRGSANTTNINIKYNGGIKAQLSAASDAFEISAVGSTTPIKFFTNGSEDMRIASGGYVAINRTTPSHYLDVDGTSLFRARLYFGTAALKSTPFGVNVTYDTGISVNAGGYGGSMLCLCSRQYNAGTGTQAALYFLHFYYDGNNQPVKHYLGGSNDFATFGQSGSNTLTVNMGASNNMFTVIESSVS